MSAGTLIYYSKSKKVWDMIRTISGKNTSSPIKHLSKNHIKATNKKDIADLLAKTFSKNSSSTNYSKPFQNVKKNAEKSKLNFKSNNLEDYNQPFSLSKLIDCIMNSHNTAVGPDEIHYEFLKLGCRLNFRRAALRDVIAVLQSSLNHDLFCFLLDVLGILSSAIDIKVWKNM